MPDLMKTIYKAFLVYDLVFMMDEEGNKWWCEAGMGIIRRVPLDHGGEAWDFYRRFMVIEDE